MAKVMRMAGDEEGEDIKATAMATRMAGKRTVMVRKRAMTMATRVVGKQGESDGNSNGDDGGGRQRGQWQWGQEHWQWQQWWLGSNSNEGNCNEGGRQTMVTRAAATMVATMRAMGMAMRLAGDKKGKGEGSKGKCYGNEGGGRQRG
jgi:hypothetical protein